MSFTIPDELLQAAHISEEEIKQEIALLLFQKGKLTLEQCSRMLGIDRIQFQRILASRDIPIHYAKEDLQEDMMLAKKSVLPDEFYKPIKVKKEKELETLRDAVKVRIKEKELKPFKREEIYDR